MSDNFKVFANLLLHAMDPINVEHSHVHLRRIVEEFEASGVKTDIYLSTGLAQSIAEAPAETELLNVLRRAAEEGYGVGMLTLASHPTPGEASRNLEWDEAYRVTEHYATLHQDLITGEFDPNRPGGARLIEKIFGRWPDIVTRRVVTDIYYHRKHGALFSLGDMPYDWLDGWVAPPLAWFMGMVTLLHYPLAENIWDYIFWPPNPNQARQLLDEIVESVPDPSPHMLFIGGHNVDFYANNPCWTAKSLGSPRHMEMWAYLKGNPPSLEKAKIPHRYLLSEELIERNYNILRVVLKTFREREKSDLDFEIVTARELVARIDTRMEQVLKWEQIVAVARFLVEKTGRGLPEWVPLDDGNALTLAQAFGVVTSALAKWLETGAIPQKVTADANLLGPTRRPREWLGYPLRSSIENVNVTIAEVAVCCGQVAQGLGKGEPPDIPIYASAGGVEINAAELLYAAAQGILKVEKGERETVQLRRLTMHPDPCIYARQPWLSDAEMSKHSTADQLFQLQLWTVKPVKFL